LASAQRQHAYAQPDGPYNGASTQHRTPPLTHPRSQYHNGPRLAPLRPTIARSSSQFFSMAARRVPFLGGAHPEHAARVVRCAQRVSAKTSVVRDQSAREQH
jgi:hypothetical protein